MGRRRLLKAELSLCHLPGAKFWDSSWAKCFARVGNGWENETEDLGRSQHHLKVMA